jgi:hypothetical protein
MDAAMAIHLHTHPHSPHPIRWFALEHPYAPDWALVISGTLLGLLLWYWHS